MIQKKICMLGASAVGKTSLVRRFVHSIFSERYHTTVGVKIDKKQLSVDGRDVLLMLWDLHGEDEFQSVRISYLRGSSGHLLVADGTRPETLKRAYALQPTMDKGVPFVLVLNKADLEAEWAVTDADLDEAKQRGWTVVRASAKTGAGVEEAFLSLARRMMG
jgi:small GTP-binding protein